MSTRYASLAILQRQSTDHLRSIMISTSVRLVSSSLACLSRVCWAWPSTVATCTFTSFPTSRRMGCEHRSIAWCQPSSAPLELQVSHVCDARRKDKANQKSSWSVPICLDSTCKHSLDCTNHRHRHLWRYGFCCVPMHLCVGYASKTLRHLANSVTATFP